MSDLVITRAYDSVWWFFRGISVFVCEIFKFQTALFRIEIRASPHVPRYYLLNPTKGTLTKTKTI